MNNNNFIKKIGIEKTTLKEETTIPKQLKAKDFFHERIKLVAKKIKWPKLPDRIAVYIIMHYKGSIAIIRTSNLTGVEWIWWKVEIGETNYDAIKREFWEELGIWLEELLENNLIEVVKPFKIIRDWWVEVGYWKHRAVQFFYICNISADQRKKLLTINAIQRILISQLFERVLSQKFHSYFKKAILPNIL